MTVGTFYELASLREQLEAAVAEQDGELSPDLESVWDALDEKFDDKTERTALWIREIEAHAEAIKAEEERLAAKRVALVNKAKRLTLLLEDAFKRYGKEKVRGVLVTVAMQQNPPKVETLVEMDESTLKHIAGIANGLYIRRIPETLTLDKEAIKLQAKNGTLDDFIQKYVKVVRTSSLRIR